MLGIDTRSSSPALHTEQISGTLNTTTIPRFLSHLRSHDLDLRTAFYNRFRESRESFGVSRERRVLNLLDGENGWKRLDKPWFKRDSLTGVIYRRSPPTHLSPDGRVTVCIPYRLAFVVAVSQSGFDGLCPLTRQAADVPVPAGLGTHAIARDL
jgi:hypothetical protein